jgi:hypothetical protein
VAGPDSWLAVGDQGTILRSGEFTRPWIALNIGDAPAGNPPPHLQAGGARNRQLHVESSEDLRSWRTWRIATNTYGAVDLGPWNTRANHEFLRIRESSWQAARRQPDL